MYLKNLTNDYESFINSTDNKIDNIIITLKFFIPFTILCLIGLILCIFLCPRKTYLLLFLSSFVLS